MLNVSVEAESVIEKLQQFIGAQAKEIAMLQIALEQARSLDSSENGTKVPSLGPPSDVISEPGVS